MKLIDRYILKELFIPFSSGILAFSVILLGSTVLFQLIGSAVKYGIPFVDVVLLIILRLPYIIALAIPMSALFSTLTVFGRLGNDLEIIALRSSGISVLRLLFPVVIFGLIVSLTGLWFVESIVPTSASTARDLYASYKYTETPKIQSNINITEYKNKLPFRIINIYEKDGFNLKNITIAEYDKGTLSRLIRAETGKWITSGAWEFYNGIMHYFPKDDNKRITVIEFQREFVNIQINPNDMAKRNRNVEEMNRKELLNEIEFTQRTGKDPIKLIMDLHTKTAIAFSSLIYCLLGASMGLKPHRSSSTMSIGLSLIIIFVYILLMAIGTGLGLSRVLPPLIAAWLPNGIIGLLSIALLKKQAST